MLKGDWRINRSPSVTPEGLRQKYQKKRAEVFAILGNVCKRCGFDDVRALQIDHVNGGGQQEFRTKSGTSYLYHVLKYIPDGRYQLLCANCNWIKRHENQEHGAYKDIKG